MNEDKASRYHRLARRAEAAALFGTAGLLAVLLLSPLSARLAAASAGVAAWSGVPAWLAPFVVVAWYVLVLALAREILILPLACYRDHVLERRYGLSTQSAGRWLRAHVKVALVVLVAAEAGAVALYAVVRAWPAWWWAVAGAGLAVARLGLMLAGPVLLLPIFYRFTPVEREGLKQRLVALAGRAGTPVLGVYGWRLSDSTRRANAALVGMGRTRRILLSDTLLSDYSDEEIEAILAHELAHHAHADLWRGLALDAAVGLAVAWLAHRALLVWAAVSPGGPADVTGLPLIVLVAGAGSLAAGPLASAQSRAHERRADRRALALTGNPAAFISALRRIGRQNLAEDRAPLWARAFFGSHPPLAERLEIAGDARAPASSQPVRADRPGRPRSPAAAAAPRVPIGPQPSRRRAGSAPGNGVGTHVARRGARLEGESCEGS